MGKPDFREGQVAKWGQNWKTVIAHFRNIIFVWMGNPDFREGQVEK